MRTADRRVACRWCGMKRWEGGECEPCRGSASGQHLWVTFPITEMYASPEEEESMKGAKDDGTLRQFGTGATRDTAEGKLDYEGFNSPLVDRRFAQYMHEHRQQSDGSLRDSDNWQKGIPLEVYIKSLHRHFMDLRLHHRGLAHLAEEPDLEKVLCALRFNVNGYLFEVLRGADTI